MTRKYTVIKSRLANHVCHVDGHFECTECREPIVVGDYYARKVVRTELESGRGTTLEVHREHLTPCCDAYGAAA